MQKALYDVSYGLTSYGRTFPTYLKQIYKLQLRLLKLIVPPKILATLKTDSEIFEYCKVLSVFQKFQLNFITENYFRVEIQKPIAHSKITRQITNKKLVTPSSTNYYGKRTSNYMIPHFLNKLPTQLKDIITKTNIKTLLKKYFLETHKSDNVDTFQ